jgi:hypothetical protein
MAIALTQYRFTLLAEQEMRLPPYLGSTLRGGFGHIFRHLCCATCRPDCKGCELAQSCPYFAVFDPSPPPDSPALRKLEEIPRPFVIEPPPRIESPLARGSLIRFGLTLIGKARDLFPYFVVSFRELGREGLGRGRGRFRLESIEALDPLFNRSESLYVFPGSMVKNSSFSASLEDCHSLAADLSLSPTSLKLAFLTPIRLKHDGHLVDRPEFHILFRSLLRRLSSLSLFHCGERLEVDYQALIRAAERVELVHDDTRWHDWERYSSRQKERMTFGGIVGQAIYRGDMAIFLPFLIFGQWTHVGKNATFGLGKYQVVRP